MQNFQQIDIEIANHDREIERRKTERDALVAQRKKSLDIELAELVARVIALGGTASVNPKKKKAVSGWPNVGPKKFRNPVTGAEWSGQGSKPSWVAELGKEQCVNPAWTAAKSAKSTKKNNGALVSEDSATENVVEAGDTSASSATVGANDTATVSSSVTLPTERDIGTPMNGIDAPVRVEIEQSPVISPINSSPSVVGLATSHTLDQVPLATPTEGPSIQQHVSTPPANSITGPVAAQVAETA